MPPLLGLAFLALLSPVTAQAGGEEPEPGHGSVTTHLGLYFKPDNGGGNPFYDESLTVVEPAMVLDYVADENWRLGATLIYDYISSASIDRLDDKRFYPKTQQSGASGDYYAGGDFQARYKQDDSNLWGGHLGYSREYDYNSLGFGGDYQWTKPGGDSRLRVALNSFLDSVKIIRWNGVGRGTDSRLSLAADVSWYQVMGRSTHGSFGAVVSRQAGFLETPFNAVVLEDPSLPFNPALEGRVRGIETNEELPDQRLRTALYGRVRRLLADQLSLELGGRLYRDDWGILAWNLEPRVYYEFVPGRFDGFFRYRYYDQDGADAWSERFRGATAGAAPRYRTQDPELGPFSSHTVGAGCTWHSGKNSTLYFSCDYVVRSDNLDHLLVGFGWGRSF